MTDAPRETRVYTSRGRVAHLLPVNESPSLGRNALCGRGAWPTGWLGTGSQREYEAAEGLPTCADCAGRLESRADFNHLRTSITKGSS